MNGESCSSDCDALKVLRAIDECGLAGRWDWRIKEGIEYYNDRFREILGFTDETDFPNVPDSWRKQIHPKDADKALADYIKHAESGGVYPYRLTVRYRHKLGHVVHVICTGKIIEWDEDGDPVRMVGTHVDVSDLVRAQEDAGASQEKLRQIRQRLERLANAT